MTSKIRVLSDHTINKIAAGEVVENPSSVVKELVENSLDAGATEVCIEIKGGGRQLIRITDNGCGMNQDDALLCLERHATSKIKDAEDLFSIATMGFRGEAIPSIAAISKFTLITRTNEDELGTMVIVDGGKILSCCTAACSKGTTIEVKSLFFNVPVRKKFLKSPAYDANEIYKTVTLLALGNPEVSFQLINNEQTLLSSSKGNLGGRIQDILGSEYFDGLIPLEGKKGETALHGFIGVPSFTRQNRTGQYLFINGRAVISPFISYMIREGYGPSIGSHRYPIFVLNLSMPGNLVDVNVHPQKREVRLRHESSLKEMITRAVEEAVSVRHEPFGFDPVLPKIEPLSLPMVEIPVSLPVRNVEEAPRITSLFNLQPAPKYPRVIATIPGYIILDPSSVEIEGSDGLCLADQRAVHSRIIFEKLSHRPEDILPKQALLIPYEFHTPGVLLEEQMNLFKSFGISIRQLSQHTCCIEAIPQAFDKINLKDFIEMIFEDLHEFNSRTAQWIAAAAARGSISKHKRLSFEEAQGLMHQLIRCKQPYQCPYGKPTIKIISSDKLSKEFC